MAQTASEAFAGLFPPDFFSGLKTAVQAKNQKNKHKHKNKKDIAIDEALRLERERAQRIAQGKGQIKSAFDVFDKAFYRNYKNDYLNYYQPQLDQQFGDARRAVRYDAARRGVDTSTPGINRFSDLVDLYAGQRRDLAASARGAKNDLKSQVATAKNTLFNQNAIAADPSLAHQGASAAVGAIQAVPQYSQLGNLFAGFVNGANTVYQNRQAMLPPGYGPLLRQNVATAPTTSPVRVVR